MPWQPRYSRSGILLLIRVMLASREATRPSLGGEGLGHLQFSGKGTTGMERKLLYLSMKKPKQPPAMSRNEGGQRGELAMSNSREHTSRSTTCRSMLPLRAHAFHNVTTASCRDFQATSSFMPMSCVRMASARSIWLSTSEEGSGARASIVHQVCLAAFCIVLGLVSLNKSNCRGSGGTSSSIMKRQMEATRNSNSFNTGTSVASPMLSCSSMAGIHDSPTETSVSNPQLFLSESLNRLSSCSSLPLAAMLAWCFKLGLSEGGPLRPPSSPPPRGRFSPSGPTPPLIAPSPWAGGTLSSWCIFCTVPGGEVLAGLALVPVPSPAELG
mmetsp:Transcript_8190/g.21834  ORF Transcript_8190/g.21834 Transcript_8190/m.21834 type:complete len:327 (-) Transcript_8190:409-1389(-)